MSMRTTSTHVPVTILALAVASIATVATGCEEKKPPLPAPPASASAASSAAAPAPKGVRFGLEAGSSATLDMPAPKEHIAARVEGATGALEIVTADLAKSHGQVKLDLTTLTTSTFKDARDKEQTAHARTWLEVADGEKGKLPDDVKEKNRYAVYDIRAVENPSATDLAKVPAAKDEAGGGDVRKVTLTTKGELTVHGKKVDKEAELECVFRYPAGAPADKPSGLTVTTKKPFVVTLAEHDVKPRNAAGALAKDFFHLLGTKVADTAAVTLDLRAKPSP